MSALNQVAVSLERSAFRELAQHWPMAIPVASETEAEAPHEPKLQKVQAKASHIAGRLQSWPLAAVLVGFPMFRNCSKLCMFFGAFCVRLRTN